MQHKLNDLSRSLTTLDAHHTVIAVIEMSLSSWVVAGIVPGVERQPLKKLDTDENSLLKLLDRWRKGGGEGRTQDQTRCHGVRGRPGWLLAGAMAQSTRHRGPRHSRIECSGVAGAPARQDRPPR